MYGTRDAAANWERKYRSHLEKIGFTCGASTPCVFFHPQRLIRLVVHGDDFTFLGCEEDMRWCESEMKKEYDVKVRGLLGPDRSDDKSIRILNRCIRWLPNSIAYEADPRHAEMVSRN